MAAPNIVNVTTINGKSAVADLGTTLTTTLLTAASDQVNKINLIRVTNVTDNDATVTIDSEVSVLVEIAYERAKKALNDNRQVLEELTAMLMETETVDSLEFQDLLIRHEVKVAEYA